MRLGLRLDDEEARLQSDLKPETLHEKIETRIRTQAVQHIVVGQP